MSYLNNITFRIIVSMAMLTIVICGSAFASVSDNETTKADSIHLVDDGPYVFVNEKQELDSYWLCRGDVVHKTVKPTIFPVPINTCHLPANIHGFSSIESKLYEFSGDFPVAALSDFHGKYDLMIALLTNNHIIDENQKWAFGKGHFIITGDIFDRGDKVTEILWFLYDLEQQATKAGGHIHLTLGNHEVMVLNGDLRYLHPKYVETAKKLGMPFEKLFTKESILGNWLRSKPVLVKVNNMLFAHGGFHPNLATEKRSIIEINNVFKNSLVISELVTPREGWAKFLHSSNGPIWYRGYFAKERGKDNGATATEIELLLAHFNVKHLIVGHTSQKQIETRYQGRVIAIDSSIKRGSYGEILFIENEKMWRGSLSGKVLTLY